MAPRYFASTLPSHPMYLLPFANDDGGQQKPHSSTRPEDDGHDDSATSLCDGAAHAASGSQKWCSPSVAFCPMYTVPVAAHGGAQHARHFGPQRAAGLPLCAIGPYGEHSRVAICRYAALGHLSVLGSGWQ